MLAIYKKEMRSYFTNPIGYVYLAIFLALSALVFCYTTLQARTYDTSTYFYCMIFALGVLLPLLTMRSFAEERKMRTEQLLLTAPISIPSMVLGKYFASFSMFAGSVLLSCVNFIPLATILKEEKAPLLEAGRLSEAAAIGPSVGSIVGSLIGIILLGAAFLAIGVFISSLTESQLSAAVSTIGVIVFLIVLSLVNEIGNDADGTRLVSNYAVRAVIDWFSVLSRFEYFFIGKFDFAALLYYFSLSSVFVFLTARVYERRRWG